MRFRLLHYFADEIDPVAVGAPDIPDRIAVQRHLHHLGIVDHIIPRNHSDPERESCDFHRLPPVGNLHFPAVQNGGRQGKDKKYFFHIRLTLL